MHLLKLCTWFVVKQPRSCAPSPNLGNHQIYSGGQNSPATLCHNVSNKFFCCILWVGMETYIPLDRAFQALSKFIQISAISRTRNFLKFKSRIEAFSLSDKIVRTLYQQSTIQYQSNAKRGQCTGSFHKLHKGVLILGRSAISLKNSFTSTRHGPDERASSRIRFLQ